MINCVTVVWILSLSLSRCFIVPSMLIKMMVSTEGVSLNTGGRRKSVTHVYKLTWLGIEGFNLLREESN